MNIQLSGSILEGLKGLEEIAEKGHVKAQYMLGQIYSGEIYRLTDGIQHDFIKADQYYTCPADQDCEAAKQGQKILREKMLGNSV